MQGWKCASAPSLTVAVVEGESIEIATTGVFDRPKDATTVIDRRQPRGLWDGTLPRRSHSPASDST